VKDFATDLSGRLKLARQIVNNHMEQNTEKYKTDHNKTAS
jgi:hypothetical protein